MREFIFSFLGAVAGSLTVYFIHKIFAVNKRINDNFNKDELSKSIDDVDEEYVNNKVNSILSHIEYYTDILSILTPSYKLNVIEIKMIYYMDWLTTNELALEKLSVSQRDELKRKIEIFMEDLHSKQE